MDRTPVSRPRPSEKRRREVLTELLRQIREDAQRAPERYLEETRVPEGGE